MDEWCLFKKNRLTRTKSILFKKCQSWWGYTKKCCINLKINGKELLKNEIILWVVYGWRW